jgi:superfamily II DNA helicase RecQ
LLGAEPQAKADLQARMKLEAEEFDKALEKLWTHGGALVDFAENVTVGHNEWRAPYKSQIAHKLERLDAMLRFADASECRMSSLVAHFGDKYGSLKPCGLCDFCAPEACEAQKFRSASSDEMDLAREILADLRKSNGSSTGKLFSAHCPSLAGSREGRDSFEQLLAAMARASLIELKDETFTKDGKEIAFRRALFVSAPPEFELPVRETPGRGVGKGRGKALPKKAKPKVAANDPVFEGLKKWRLEQAKKQGVPAFRIMSDKVLQEITADAPRDEDELLEVAGMGPKLVEKYGASILKVLART